MTRPAWVTVHLRRDGVSIEAHVVTDQYPPVVTHGTQKAVDDPTECHSFRFRSRSRDSVDTGGRRRNGEVRRVYQMCFDREAPPWAAVRRPGDLHDPRPLANR
jgi:hypothetical protein